MYFKNLLISIRTKLYIYSYLSFKGGRSVIKSITQYYYSLLVGGTNLSKGCLVYIISFYYIFRADLYFSIKPKNNLIRLLNHFRILSCSALLG